MLSDKFISMFREYDVRGRISEDELCDRNVERIAKAFAVFLSGRGIRRVVVGYDNRKASLLFYNIVVETLANSGFEVIAVGLTLSPVVYFAQHYYQSPGAIMVTASHNPDGWSGFKMSAALSTTLSKDEIQELLRICADGGQIGGACGIIRHENVRDAYIDNIVSRVKMNKAFLPKLVIDAGNGGAGVFAYEIFQRLGCVVFQLNCDPDDSYPHYFPNPSDLAARAQLNKMVLHPYIQADIGISFDGDGDRIGVMDEHGQDIWGDKLLLLLSKQLLLKKKNAKIIFDVKCTQALPEFIQSNGGIPIVCKTGHSYIKAKMKAEGADLGGERSGHIYSGGDEYWGFDDALFAAAKLVEYVSNENKPVSGLVCGFPAYYSSPEIYAKCADRDKYAVVERFAAELQQKFPDNETLTINGVKMFFTDGWGLVRASSNMPELSIVFEAKTKEGLKEIFDLYHSMLSAYPEVDGNWGNIKFD